MEIGNIAATVTPSVTRPHDVLCSTCYTCFIGTDTNLQTLALTFLSY